MIKGEEKMTAKIEKTNSKELMEKSLSRMEAYRKQWEQLWKEREENTEKEEKTHA